MDGKAWAGGQSSPFWPGGGAGRACARSGEALASHDHIDLPGAAGVQRAAAGLPCAGQPADALAERFRLIVEREAHVVFELPGRGHDRAGRWAPLRPSRLLPDRPAMPQPGALTRAAGHAAGSRSGALGRTPTPLLLTARCTQTRPHLAAGRAPAGGVARTGEPG